MQQCCIKQSHIDYVVTTFGRSMKLSIFVVAAFTASVIGSQGSRMSLFRKHHRTATEIIVRRNVCTAKTCNKCQAISTGTDEGMAKIRAVCSKLFRIPGCCSGARFLYNMF